ncbi:MAG: hypothetical protein ACXWP6_15310 [Ktedonobacterales bacterium]
MAVAHKRAYLRLSDDGWLGVMRYGVSCGAARRRLARPRGRLGPARAADGSFPVVLPLFLPESPFSIGRGGSLRLGAMAPLECCAATCPYPDVARMAWM